MALNLLLHPKYWTHKPGSPNLFYFTYLKTYWKGVNRLHQFARSVYGIGTVKSLCLETALPKKGSWGTS